MPNDEGPDRPRLVLDESSFDFRDLTMAQIEDSLDEFNATLDELTTQGDLTVHRPPLWDAVECLEGCELIQFLCHEYPSAVDRDVTLRTLTSLDRCPEWEPRPGAAVAVAIGPGARRSWHCPSPTPWKMRCNAGGQHVWCFR